MILTGDWDHAAMCFSTCGGCMCARHNEDTVYFGGLAGGITELIAGFFSVFCIYNKQASSV